MYLNKKVNAALAILAHMEKTRKPDELVTVAELVEEVDISCSYIEQIMRVLRDEELVVATRGRNGGYQLALVGDTTLPEYRYKTLQELHMAFYPESSDLHPMQPLWADGFQKLDIGTLLVAG